MEVARNYELNTDSVKINPNILDVVGVVNSFSPTEIIKLQRTSQSTFGSFEQNLEKNFSRLTDVPGRPEIIVPQVSNNNSYKVQIQIIAPKTIQRGTAYPIA